MPTDETPDVGYTGPAQPAPSQVVIGSYNMEDIKPWYQSKAIMTPIASFGLYMLKYIGFIAWPTEMIIQVQTFVITLALIFTRTSDKKIVSGKTYKRAKLEHKARLAMTAGTTKCDSCPTQ
jgi:hypothetical protein